jgi:hypothetical protein
MLDDEGETQGSRKSEDEDLTYQANTTSRSIGQLQGLNVVPRDKEMWQAG